MSTTTNSLRATAVSSPIGSTGVENQSLLVLIAKLAKGAVATVAAAFQARPETPAEAAERLRVLADEYEATQPSFAADLRAVISRTQTREGV